MSQYSIGEVIEKSGNTAVIPDMKVVLIDLSYQLHRSLRQPNLWELKTKMVNPETKEVMEFHTGGVYGVLSILGKLMREFPGYMPVFASDKGLDPRRLECQPNYKHHADRKEALANPISENLLTSEEIQKIKDDAEYFATYVQSKVELKAISKALGIPYIEMKGVEGDDILAILACHPSIKHSVVVSDDRDLIQIVGMDENKYIRNYRAMKGETYTLKRFKEEYVDISRFVAIKSIEGDGSDNIDQVAKGVGGVTAKKFIDLICEKGFTVEQLSSPCKLIEGEYDGECKMVGRGKARHVEYDTTPKVDNPAVQCILDNYTTKASRSFVKSLCEGNQLASNLEMIDLRKIQPELVEKVVLEYAKEYEATKATVPSILRIAPILGKFKIKNLPITDIVKGIKDLKTL